jgi:hypothetical protein
MKPKENPKPNSQPIPAKPGELSEKLKEWMDEETRDPSWEGELSRRVRRR